MLVTDLSDHFPVLTFAEKVLAQRQKSETITFRPVNPQINVNISQAIQETNWEHWNKNQLKKDIRIFPLKYKTSLIPMTR